MSNWHLLPVKDLKEHEESTTCECEPKVEFQENGDMLIIHNSFDGREAIEMFNEIINKKRANLTLKTSTNFIYKE